MNAFDGLRQLKERRTYIQDSEISRVEDGHYALKTGEREDARLSRIQMDMSNSASYLNRALENGEPIPSDAIIRFKALAKQANNVIAQEYLFKTPTEDYAGANNETIRVQGPLEAIQGLVSALEKAESERKII